MKQKKIKNKKTKNKTIKNKSINKINLILITLILFSFLTPFAFAAPNDIVISEVYPNPISSETGGEAIILFNPTENKINLSQYVIKTESSNTDVIFPDNKTIESYHYFLITDSGWGEAKDDPTWPNADLQDAFTLSNSNAGVALVKQDQIIDAVGWGSSENIDEGLFENTPVKNPNEGKSITRSNLFTDSNNNSADFELTNPTPKNSEYSELPPENPDEEEGEDIDIDVNIDNIAPTINKITILTDDDELADDIQIAPNPGSEKEIEIQTTITDLNGIDEITQIIASIDSINSTTNFTLIQEINETTALFNGTISIPFYITPGETNLKITANDSELDSELTTKFTVLSVTALSVDSNSIKFLDPIPNAFTNLLGDLNSQTNNPTIKNIGNTNLNIGIYGMDLTSSTNTLDVNNIEYSFTDEINEQNSISLSNDLVINNLNLIYGKLSVAPLSFRLFIPASTKSGNYSGSATLVALSD
ncbi:lamin tail domain-containing protein [Candidatus Woesearchaeota archaeon]|jgi:hypothetical protein|nr:lamin tail domain-containing protein [Candidatus Woesearchaeota archaeon]MBT6519512.1 lamin tail domain-containing protein [Candidatus Woesearchaeota archaeon]MBT7367411.1 lamin tail domain-containing protein [Candidatus Woesearchaeota archaeon]